MTNWVVAYIGIGSNIGDRLAHLRHAVRTLSGWRDTEFVRASALYESAGLEGASDDADFLNAVVMIRTALTPELLLNALQTLEREEGRTPTGRHAPRPLDLDILFYGEQTVLTPRLQIPHSRIYQRAFVCLPLFEIAPHLQLPDSMKNQHFQKVSVQKCEKTLDVWIK